MFNLAQRHFRISLWGTEPANKSTYKESKREKEALFGAVATGLGCKLHSTAASACCFCQEDRCSFQFTLLSVLWTFSTLCETTKWDDTTSTRFCCLKLHSALWQSNVQALASWSTEVNKNINKKTLFLSYLARECFHFLCN